MSTVPLKHVEEKSTYPHCTQKDLGRDPNPKHDFPADDNSREEAGSKSYLGLGLRATIRLTLYPGRTVKLLNETESFLNNRLLSYTHAGNIERR